MIIENKRNGKLKIGVGDVISYEDQLCWVTYREDYSFPYAVNRLEDGISLNSFADLEALEKSAYLVCPADKVRIILEN